MTEQSLIERMRACWKRIDPTETTDDPVGMTMASQLLAEAAARLELLEGEHSSLLNGRIPTHRCKVCGALWTLWPPDPTNLVEAIRPGSWSLFTPRCGQCCDNVVMGDQIEQLPVAWPFLKRLQELEELVEQFNDGHTPPEEP